MEESYYNLVLRRAKGCERGRRL